MVGNFTITDESNLFNSFSVEKATISSAMNTIKSGQSSVLSLGQLQLLKSTYGGFSEIRIKCRKPSAGRTTHIVLAGDAFVHNLITNRDGSYHSNPSGYFIRAMSDDDDSDIGKSTSHAFEYNPNTFYSHIVFVWNIGHIQIGSTDRLECDDSHTVDATSFHNIGNWQFFVR